MADRATSTKAPKSFEAAVDELEQILGDVEREEVSLEQSVARFERGAFLLKWCRSTLTDAEQRIQKLSSEDNATAEAERQDA
jgi:exodeoxyribonuclease VII small subunit